MISTYARLALSDWQVLSKLIVKHGTLFHAETKTPVNPLLEIETIQEAFRGPYQAFLRERLPIYSGLGRVKSKLITTQQDLLKRDSATPLPPEQTTLPAELLAGITMPMLEQIKQQLDQNTQEQYAQWQEAVNYWKNGLSQYLNQTNIVLTDIELEEFMRDETVSEVFTRYKNLSIPLPSMKNGCSCFGIYLRLKTVIAVYSSLNRRMQPHNETDIELILKPLSNYFSDIEKYERQMIENQQQLAMQIIHPIAFALTP